jgi:mannose-6-phosphate isomerase-like protein (cupin superfamily)
MVTRHNGDFTWTGVDVLPYKEDGNIFRNVTRQKLFAGAFDLPVELRYFEVGVDGHSTLERHEHAHLVVVIRGSGQVLVGDQISDIQLHDVVHVPPLTWHQFRATKGDDLGFLCVVNQERDRPQRPGEQTLAETGLPEHVHSFVRL